MRGTVTQRGCLVALLCLCACGGSDGGGFGSGAASSGGPQGDGTGNAGGEGSHQGQPAGGSVSTGGANNGGSGTGGDANSSGGALGSGGGPGNPGTGGDPGVGGGTVITGDYKNEMIFCGAKFVYIYELDLENSVLGAQTWSWTAADTPQTGQGFASNADCKPVRGGSQILITSSSSGVALVDRATKQASFTTRVTNSHSGDLLPGNRFLIAGSSGADTVTLYNEELNAKAIWSDSCPGCHGVVWDDERKRAYVLGYSGIQIYELADWEGANPSLTLIETVTGIGGGHDIFPVGNTPEMSVAGGGVYLFNRETHEVKSHPDIGQVDNVKSVNHHPVTDQVAYTRGDILKGYNTYTIRFKRPDQEIDVEPMKTYKVRWLVTPL